MARIYRAVITLMGESDALALGITKSVLAPYPVRQEEWSVYEMLEYSHVYMEEITFYAGVPIEHISFSCGADYLRGLPWVPITMKGYYTTVNFVREVCYSKNLDIKMSHIGGW